MTGSIIAMVQHRCGTQSRWLQLQRASTEVTCKHCGAQVVKGLRRYDARWRSSGKQRSKLFASKKEAEKFLSATVSSVHDGTHVHVRPRPMRQVIDEWLVYLEAEHAAGRLKASTWLSYQSTVRVHLRPAFGDVRSDRLSADDVAKWERSVIGRLGDGAQVRVLAILASLLRWGRGPGRRYLGHNPFDDFKAVRRGRTRARRPERRFLEPAEVEALIAAVGAPHNVMITTLAYTGIRKNELFGLRWSDLDEERCQLRIRRGVYERHVSAPKTVSSERAIDIPSPLVKLLQQYREAYPPITTPALKGDSYIFRTPTGAHLSPNSWSTNVFVPAAVRAGLRPATASDSDAQLVAVHALRHSYAARLLNAGEQLQYVSRQLGHASIAVTGNVYGHILRESRTATMARLGMQLSASVIMNPANEADSEVERAG